MFEGIGNFFKGAWKNIGEPITQSIGSLFGLNLSPSQHKQIAESDRQAQEAYQRNQAEAERAYQRQKELLQEQQLFSNEQREFAQAYNTEEAQKQRDWQTEMSNTEVQRKMEDMKASGLNPILAGGGAHAGQGGLASVPIATSAGAPHGAQAGAPMGNSNIAQNPLVDIVGGLLSIVSQGTKKPSNISYNIDNYWRAS